jgi:hypothetical protein
MEQFKPMVTVLSLMVVIVVTVGASLARQASVELYSSCSESAPERRTEPELSAWVGCVSSDQTPQSQALCNAAGEQVDRRRFRAIRDGLRSEGLDTKARLCTLDAPVIWSYNNCAREAGGVSLMGEAVRLLAYNWARLGELQRADLLFSTAYSLVTTDVGVLGKMAVLKDWTHVKLRLGEGEQAKRLAELYAALARRKYQETQGDQKHPELLINALLFKAKVLQELGLSKEAQATREEAEGLSSQLQ